MSKDSETEMRVVRVPVLDTGIGIEAGYANDEELIKAVNAQREEMKALLTPETWAKFEAAELEAQRRFITG